MGRKKIIVSKIEDERQRNTTFVKRKSGLVKKAMELSILCDCEISLVIFSKENNKMSTLYEYSSVDPRIILQKYCTVAHLPHERFENTDYELFQRKKRGVIKSTEKQNNNEEAEEEVGEERNSNIQSQPQPNFLPAKKRSGTPGMDKFQSTFGIPDSHQVDVTASFEGEGIQSNFDFPTPLTGFGGSRTNDPKGINSQLPTPNAFGILNTPATPDLPSIPTPRYLN